ncbi:MAG: glucans biosynthesis protein [Syntrophorhabdus sp. PtaB.Bin184]|nr:MAG: glucans biosynthesis protein [Syntrophorhabdus sp. PtaB.Bin184]
MWHNGYLCMQVDAEISRVPQSEPPPGAKRMVYLDNLRLSFTFLVILHHVCLTYAATSGWYFYQHLDDPFTNLVLNVLMGVGRTWVLACFFLISGYFTPGSLDRKGTWWFIKDRFIRIGIPLGLFALIIRPTMVYLLKRDTLSLEYSYVENILLLKNAAPGPAWFLEVLLVFSLAYAAWRALTRSHRERERNARPFPGNGAVILFILVLAAFTFVMRIYLPSEKQILHLRLGNYAEYVAFFFAGIVAYRNRWLEKLTDLTGKQWTVITGAAVCVYIFFIVQAWDANESLSFLRGGFSLKTLITTYVGTFIAVGSSICLTYLFRTYLNAQPGIVGPMTQDAYAAFIFHSPIIVAVTYWMQDTAVLHPFIKFLSAFVVGTVLSFLICHYFVKKIPYAKRVL